MCQNDLPQIDDGWFENYNICCDDGKQADGCMPNNWESNPFEFDTSALAALAELNGFELVPTDSNQIFSRQLTFNTLEKETGDITTSELYRDTNVCLAKSDDLVEKVIPTYQIKSAESEKADTKFLLIEETSP